MIKNILFVALVFLMISCASEGTLENMTEGGYKYTHVKTNGEKVKEGDYVYITLKLEDDKGELLQEIEEGPNMPVMQMPTAENPLQFTNPVVDMLMMGALGDSMTLFLPVDSLPNKNNPRFAGVEYLKYGTCIKMIKDEKAHMAYMEEMRLEAEKLAEASKARLSEVGKEVEQRLADYRAGKLDVQTTPEGLKYVIHTEGDGPYGEKGKRATVHYYGALMDGTMFDSSFKAGRPYPFMVGAGSVIKGWDEGIPLVKKGGTASLFIPYEMAYGEAGRPPSIPEKAELYFYVELVDVM